METYNSDKIAQTRNKIFNISKERKSMKIKPLTIYSSLSNANIKNRQIRFIPLSLLFKNKLSKNKVNNKYDISSSKDKNFGSAEKSILSPSQINMGNSLFSHNTLSKNRIPVLTSTKIKLPKIKYYKGNDNLQSGIITSILEKFKQCDNKFREQGKISSFIIKKAEQDLKLTKDYINDEEHKFIYYASKNNIKKQYSRVYKRIKKIQAI